MIFAGDLGIYKENNGRVVYSAYGRDYWAENTMSPRYMRCTFNPLWVQCDDWVAPEDRLARGVMMITGAGVLLSSGELVTHEALKKYRLL